MDIAYADAWIMIMHCNEVSSLPILGVAVNATVLLYILLLPSIFVIQRSLATDLQSLSMDFRKQQKGYLQKLRRQQEVHLRS